MKKTSGIIPLTLLSLLLLAAIPSVSASTLTVTINPSTKSAELQSVSATTIVLTYPSGSPLSEELQNFSSSVSYSSSFSGGSGPVLMLQDGFALRDDSAHIQNMSISYSLTAKGNTTALVVHKTTNITAWVSGLFSVENGTVHIDLGWRAFAVPGNMTVNLQGRLVDINLVGSTVASPFFGRPLVYSFLLARFSRYSIWDYATLNFSALDTSLTTWTRHYDSATNTTTFSKTVAGTSTFSASATYNGQDFSLKVTSDPSATIATKGYAVASANSLTVTTSPGTVSVADVGIIAVVAIATIATMAAYFVKKSHANQDGQTPAGTAHAPPVSS